MSQPPVGMRFDDVEKRVRRMTKSEKMNPLARTQLVKSLIDQAARHEGEGAKKELREMLKKDYGRK